MCLTLVLALAFTLGLALRFVTVAAVSVILRGWRVSVQILPAARAVTESTIWSPFSGITHLSVKSSWSFEILKWSRNRSICLELNYNLITLRRKTWISYLRVWADGRRMYWTGLDTLIIIIWYLALIQLITLDAHGFIYHCLVVMFDKAKSRFVRSELTLWMYGYVFKNHESATVTVTTYSVSYVRALVIPVFSNWM